MKAKFVVIRTGTYDETPYIFPISETHSIFAKKVSKLRFVISAGFVTIKDGKLVPYGESVSIGVGSRGEEDEKLFEEVFG